MRRRVVYILFLSHPTCYVFCGFWVGLTTHAPTLAQRVYARALINSNLHSKTWATLKVGAGVFLETFIAS